MSNSSHISVWENCKRLVQYLLHRRGVPPIPHETQEGVYQNVKFLCEQDGGTERLLKRRLREYFRATAPECRAYLVRVRYDDSGTFNVALCLQLNGGKERKIIKDTGNIFAAIFSASTCMDTLVLTDEQEAEVRLVANPFFP